MAGNNSRQFYNRNTHYCLLNFFCKSMAASNSCNERKTALNPADSLGHPSASNEDDLKFYCDQLFENFSVLFIMAHSACYKAWFTLS